MITTQDPPAWIRGKKKRGGLGLLARLIADRAQTATADRYAGQAREYDRDPSILRRYTSRRSPKIGSAITEAGPTGMDVQDLLSRIAAASSQVDPALAGAAGMVAGSVGSAPTIDIAAALAPYDQAKTSVERQHGDAVAELGRIAAGRDADRGLVEADTQARLRELAARTSAANESLVQTNRTDAAAGAADLAAQGVDPSYAAASEQARRAGADQVSRAAQANIDSEQAAADRSMAALTRADQEQAYAGQQNVNFNRDAALNQIVAGRAQAESELQQAQAALNSDFAQRQADANIQAAQLLAEGRQDPLAMQQQALEYLSQLPNGGQVFPQRQAVEQSLAEYDPNGEKVADDVFRYTASQSPTIDDFVANLETALAAKDEQDGPRRWDRDWFRSMAQRYYEPGGVDRRAGNNLLMYLLGPQAAAAAQPFGGIRQVGRPW